MRICKCLFFFFTIIPPINFSILWWFLPATITVMFLTNGDFSIFIIPFTFIFMHLFSNLLKFNHREELSLLPHLFSYLYQHLYQYEFRYFVFGFNPILSFILLYVLFQLLPLVASSCLSCVLLICSPFDFKVLLTFWHHDIFQLPMVLSLPWLWNQTFFKGALFLLLDNGI